MLRSRTYLAVLLFAALGSRGFAQSEENVKAEIPFSFEVGKSVLPAGEYMLSPSGSTNDKEQIIRSEDGKHAVNCIVEETRSPERAGHTALTFAEVGQRFYLRTLKIQGEETGREVNSSLFHGVDLKNAKTRELTGTHTRHGIHSG